MVQPTVPTPILKDQPSLADALQKKSPAKMSNDHRQMIKLAAAVAAGAGMAYALDPYFYGALGGVVHCVRRHFSYMDYIDIELIGGGALLSNYSRKDEVFRAAAVIIAFLAGSYAMRTTL